MTSYIKFTPLSGAYNEDPLCYLLELDDSRILLDCGWSDRTPSETLREVKRCHLFPNGISGDRKLTEWVVKRIAKTVDAVLLSHGDLEHCGALPLLYGKGGGLSCSTYATFPVQNMGNMTVTDLYKSRMDESPFTDFSLHDIHEAFERKMVPLRYSQPYALSGRLIGVTITAYPAGHTIGGTIWKIKKDTEVIVYAVDYNHKKERHLNGTILHVSGDLLSRPTLLITDSYNASAMQPTRKQRDTFLIDTIVGTLKKNGNVLIPTDSSLRLLELAYLLEQAWSFQNIPYHFILLAHQGSQVLGFARNMLEWMGEAAVQSFSQKKENPFDLRRLKVVKSSEEIHALSGPKLVLASFTSLDTGFASHLFRSWSMDPLSTLILPDKGPTGSLCRRLYENWISTVENGSDEDQLRAPAVLDMDLNMIVQERVYLEGEELDAHIAAEAERKRIQEEQEAIRRTLAGEDEDELSDIEEEATQGGPGELVTGLTAAESLNPNQQQQLTYHPFDIYVKDMPRSSGFFKHAQAYRMFPVNEPRCRVDEYGETIDPSAYMREEEQTAIEVAAGHGPVTEKAEDLKEKGEEEDDEGKERPHKYVEYPLELRVSCQVVYIDFEGRSDGKSIKNILSQVAPRKLILIHGSKENTEHLAQHCYENTSMTDEVYAPHLGACLDVSSATNLYKVTLTDPLVSSLNIAHFGDYQLSYISGIILNKKEDQIAPTSEVEGEGTENMEVEGSLEEKQATETTSLVRDKHYILDVARSESVRFHKPVMIGDVKLSEFRNLLQSRGFSVDFVKGVLVVNGRVMVRKDGQNLKLEGGINADYFSVRRLLYELHAII